MGIVVPCLPPVHYLMLLLVVLLLLLHVMATGRGLGTSPCTPA